MARSDEPATAGDGFSRMFCFNYTDKTDQTTWIHQPTCRQETNEKHMPMLNSCEIS